MLNLIIFTVGLIGAALVAFGAWLVFEPAGYIAAGVFCLTWSWLAAKSAARQQAGPDREGS